MDEIAREQHYLELIDALNDAEALRQEIIARFRAADRPWDDSLTFRQIMADWDAADARIHEAREALRAVS